MVNVFESSLKIENTLFITRKNGIKYEQPINWLIVAKSRLINVFTIFNSFRK